MTPRRKSFNIPGHAHELTFTCYRRFAFLNTDRTRNWLAEAIAAVRLKHELLIWAYVFMPDHAHIILYPQQKQYDISQVLADMKRPVGKQAIAYLQQHAPAWIPRITRQRGPRVERLFWQSGGGYDRNIDNPKTLWRMIDYLHNNPVRKGWVPNAADWLWSSAAAYEGGTSPIPIDPMPQAWAAA